MPAGEVVDGRPRSDLGWLEYRLNKTRICLHHMLVPHNPQTAALCPLVSAH
eukprot:m.377692 g.377692  ORF g.377692 m.377692 type:complete len:51 (+) comp88306_c0_seq1:116-268(+)